MAVNREAVVASAEKYVARGKIESAIKEYRKLISENPNDAMTLNRVGDLYVRINRNDEAVRLFLQIADRYTEDGFFVKAIAIFKKIIKLDPTRLPIYERLAELYHKQGLVTEARTQYQVLVDYYLKHDKVDAAESVLRKMTALDSGDPSPHVKLAEIYRDRGEHDQELAEYKQLAEMMLRHKRVEEATQVYSRAISAFPSDLAFITDAVLGLKDAGHNAAAAKLLALAVEKNPQAEKIARIAGLARGAHTEVSSSHVRRPSLGEPETPPQRVLKVSDVAPVPPELRDLRPRPPEPPRATARPQPTAEELEWAQGAEDELSDSQIRRREQAEDRGELLQSIDEPQRDGETLELEAPEGAEGVEFELEIEALDADAPPLGAETEPAGPAPDIDWSFAPEPDLDLELELPAEPEPEAEIELEPQVGRELPAAPAPAAPPEPPAAPPERRLADLLAEAEVFRKYGLREKAHDRVREILQEDPRHAATLSLAVNLLVDEGKHDRALSRAQQLESLASESEANADLWGALRARLEKSGYRFDDGRLAGAPVAKPREKDKIAKLLDELAGVAPARPKRPKSAAEPDLSALVDELRPAARAAKPPVAPTPAAPPPDLAVPPELAAPPAPPPSLAAPPAAESAPAGSIPLEFDEEAIDDKLSWLDDAEAQPTPRQPTAADESLFDEEEGFFDLAAELEQELTQEELATGEEMLPREEPSLEEIVEGFKKGVAESLSPEDYDTHFNLGIAYREMGLLDEAIGEFQLAAKHPNYLLDCCSLLGGCFLEKGLPELAIKWYQRGLATEGLSEEANSGLLYELGNLYLATADHDSARRTFVELYGINSNYRDVVAKLEELRAL